ncbi:MAG: signal peptide peptidase SppA, partial [Desulfobacterales bacterium]|nr:signal peptide peptidase SppA [Desulfobacterales bacterium]
MMKKNPILIGIIVIGVIMVVFIGAILLLTLMFRRETPSFAMGAKVGVVEITGVISDSSEVIRGIRYLADDGGVKAIVLRIDSPGGGGGASQEIYQEVIKARGAKPVVASFGGVAASGGYYVACGADKIVANPGTITGSIGVVMQFANLEELLKKIGYKGYVIKSGTHKDIGSPFREMTPEEKELLQGVIDTVHQQFIKAVAEGRKLPIEKVTAIADGRIFAGEQAKALGLVDELGNLEDTIQIAATMAGIKGRPAVVYTRKRKLSLFDSLTQSIAQRFKEEIQQQQAPPDLQYMWY